MTKKSTAMNNDHKEYKDSNGFEIRINGLTGPDLKTPLQVERPIYQIEELNKESMYEKPSSTFKEKCAKAFRNVTPLSFLYQTVPLLKWLPEYYWRKDIVGDIISGITVAIMHIPQGMAYGLLGGVPPIVGIYMAFFPVLAYFIFGTSRHVSIGTFAIVCLMTGKVVNTHATVEILQNGTLHTIQENLEGKPTYTNVEVALTVTFTVALIELIMYVLRLGVVSTLLSRTLVNGFTCASAFHVASSQLKDLLGLALKKRSGHFSFPLTVYDAFKEIPNANLAAVKVSAISIILLFLNNEFFKPWLAKKTKIPFPVELIAVVVGTLVSTFLHLEVDYNVTTIGNIPTGLPNPMLPRFALMPEILLDSFLIAMVSYTITMAMALIFARKLTYDVDSNQELLALGVSNTVGSFFGCLPVAASLSRSVIQQTVGGVSQIASVVSAGLLLIVLLWVGPLFESLPRCVLASIIVVALKSLLSEVTSFIHYWKLSKWDGIVWIVTFLTTLIFQISVGLIVGIAVSCLSIFIQGYRPYTCLLGLVPNTDLYLDVKRYKAAQEINGLKIFHYSGGLSFASGASFKQLFVRKVGVDAQAILQKRIKMKRKGLTHDSEEEEQLTIKCVILDFSSLTFVDPSGVDFLRTLQNDLNSLGIALYIVGCSGPVFEVIQKCDKTEKKESKFIIFPTVHDAVLFAQANLFNKNE